MTDGAGKDQALSEMLKLKGNGILSPRARYISYD
jgi:hypothetical protein